MFPLSSDDIPMERDPLDFARSTSDLAEPLSGPSIDFTSQDYITALITDLGVLTPSAVSEELIKMWYD